MKQRRFCNKRSPLGGIHGFRARFDQRRRQFRPCFQPMCLILEPPTPKKPSSTRTQSNPQTLLPVPASAPDSQARQWNRRRPKIPNGGIRRPKIVAYSTSEAAYSTLPILFGYYFKIRFSSTSMPLVRFQCHSHIVFDDLNNLIILGFYGSGQMN